MAVDSERPLKKGQVWATHAASIEIVALGQRLIHYRIMNRIGQDKVSAQISGIKPMENYLKRHAARLVSGAGEN